MLNHSNHLVIITKKKGDRVAVQVAQNAAKVFKKTTVS